jgi:hypothetical protein
MCLALIAVLNVSLFTTTEVTESIQSGGTIHVSDGLSISVPVKPDAPATPEPKFGEIKVNTISLTWGEVTPGGTSTQEIIVTNTLATPTQISLSSSNWVPSEFQQYMTLTWDYNGVPIQPSQSISVYLQLEVNPNIADITSFTFDVDILGVQL